MANFDNMPRVKAHCDALVLHAPNECRYCDMYPTAQLWRIKNKINFTGHYKAGFTQCPAEAQRPLETINRWHGNVAMDESQLQRDREYFAELERLLKERIEIDNGAS